jgi:hypothetical protein
VDDLFVVGSVGNSGSISSFSDTAVSDTADFVEIYAPGENVKSPYWAGLVQDFDDHQSGTSQGT